MFSATGLQSVKPLLTLLLLYRILTCQPRDHIQGVLYSGTQRLWLTAGEVIRPCTVFWSDWAGTPLWPARDDAHP
ncbi:hypothetical protein BO83DRAFT_74534 [Aspergillus eucalypticola CBS 122712]|uniref:Secreted protein n=1 Tax=Aspergillus eucalypticola (strain CBS 122712 / IBT 29274) TaxID=1448314 RepID=A0A317V598_ASPEC|nr:uncharacterized protein BO83DRAFT_74534 [Aspergillus eucalypticola CBS 122712]PWY68769.1 hypothetical protein BO83DRAFT_74534 [Aspergillus eucalypticola CBS 122712]